jgi:hypothetical protein
VVYQEDILVLLEWFCSHKINPFVVLIENYLNDLVDVKVFKLEFLEELAMQVLGKLNSGELKFVELLPVLEVFIGL